MNTDSMYMIFYAIRYLGKSFLQPKINVLAEWVIGACLGEEWADQDLWWVQEEEEEVDLDFTVVFQPLVDPAHHDLRLEWAPFLVASQLVWTGNFYISESYKENTK